jgi:hypothetical protein
MTTFSLDAALRIKHMEADLVDLLERLMEARGITGRDRISQTVSVRLDLQQIYAANMTAYDRHVVWNVRLNDPTTSDQVGDEPPHR